MKRSHLTALAILSVLTAAACSRKEEQPQTAPVEETAPPPAPAPAPPMPDTGMMRYDTMGMMRTDTSAMTTTR